MYKALIIRTKKLTLNFTNTCVKFDQNAVILLKNDKPLGSRIFGPVPLKLRNQKLFKIIALANILI
jgi:large subunit ribosomal protein L14